MSIILIMIILLIPIIITETTSNHNAHNLNDNGTNNSDTNHNHDHDNDNNHNNDNDNDIPHYAVRREPPRAPPGQGQRPGGARGFQGNSFHLSTNHFDIIREMYGFMTFVCLFLLIGPP